MEKQIQQMEDGIHQEYKDWDVYENDRNAVCYIPLCAWEFGDDIADYSYSHNDLLTLVRGDETLCDQLFELLNWTTPEFMIDTNVEDGMWGYCSVCDQYYDTHDEEVIYCPKCEREVQ